MTTVATWRRRWRATGLGMAAAATVLAGCADRSAAPAAPTAPAAPVVTATAAPESGGATSAVPSSAPPRPGCAPTGAAVPAGASVARTADLDHDGAPDELWLADVRGQRLLGVRTASGAVFSTAFTSAAPQRASAVGQALGPDLSIVLLDAGRSVPLYAVADCQLTPTQNPQGQQYTFDLGFTGFGTGVGCEPAHTGGQRWDLYGLLAHQAGAGWTVTGTRIDLGESGRTAHNGPSSDLVTGADGQAAAVQAARTVTCGDQTSGPREPES